jgi:hypothetical protein
VAALVVRAVKRDEESLPCVPLGREILCWSIPQSVLAELCTSDTVDTTQTSAEP